MLHKHSKRLSRIGRRTLAAGTLALATAATAIAQTSGSGNAAPGSAPMQGQSSSQTPGTTAAPGTAAIHSREVANAIAPQRVATYTEKYEIFGGLSFMNGQAGQNLPKRYNMGGGEVMGTYWLGSPANGGFKSHLGVAADYRLEAGTTPILPVGTAYGLNRVLVYQNIISGGVQYRGPRNRYAAINLHALVGASHGTFDTAVVNNPALKNYPNAEAYVGLYPNTTTPWGAAGGSIDFNYSPRVAIRVSPDILFEHFGTETREFVSVGGGIVYRFGKR